MHNIQVWISIARDTLDFHEPWRSFFATREKQQDQSKGIFDIFKIFDWFLKLKTIGYPRGEMSVVFLLLLRMVALTAGMLVCVCGVCVVDMSCCRVSFPFHFAVCFRFFFLVFVSFFFFAFLVLSFLFFFRFCICL